MSMLLEGYSGFWGLSYMPLKLSLRCGPFMTHPFSIRRGPPSPNSHLRAFQDVVALLETAVPAVPENELIMVWP